MKLRTLLIEDFRQFERLELDLVDVASQANLGKVGPLAIFAKSLQSMDSPSFVADRRHLTELGGHDLVTALWTWLDKRQIKKLSGKQPRQLSIVTLEDQLYSAFEAAYVPNETFQPDEFALLADRLRGK